MDYCDVVRFSREIGGIKLQATVLPSQEGLTVTIYGGDKPHVGAVALAVPRPSLADPTRISATTSIITLVGHKDDEIAKSSAERLAKEFEQPVAVVAGVHMASPTQEDIKVILELVEELIDQIILHFQS